MQSGGGEPTFFNIAGRTVGVSVVPQSAQVPAADRQVSQYSLEFGGMSINWKYLCPGLTGGGGSHSYVVHSESFSFLHFLTP